jgi:hypothetical protein
VEKALRDADAASGRYEVGFFDARLGRAVWGLTAS